MVGFFGKKKIQDSAQLDPDAITAELSKSLASADSPWLKATLKYRDELVNARIQTKNWQRQALLSWLLSVAAVGGMAYIGSLPKIKPYPIEVDHLGRVRAVRALSENDTRIDPERIIVAELDEMIVNLRTVTTDREANNRNISKGLSRLAGAAHTYAYTELRKAPPNEVGTTKTVQVKTYPPLKISDGVWQIEWEELSQNLAGQLIGSAERWKAVITVKLQPNLDDEEIFKKNPYGFQGHQLNWTRVGLR